MPSFLEMDGTYQEELMADNTRDDINWNRALRDYDTVLQIYYLVQELEPLTQDDLDDHADRIRVCIDEKNWGDYSVSVPSELADSEALEWLQAEGAVQLGEHFEHDHQNKQLLKLLLADSTNKKLFSLGQMINDWPYHNQFEALTNIRRKSKPKEPWEGYWSDTKCKYVGTGEYMKTDRPQDYAPAWWRKSKSKKLSTAVYIKYYRQEDYYEDFRQSLWFVSAKELNRCKRDINRWLEAHRVGKGRLAKLPKRGNVFGLTDGEDTNKFVRELLNEGIIES